MSKNSLLVTCIIGMAISGAVLIFLISSLFKSDGQGNIWIMVALGVLGLAFAAGARYWRPSSPTTNDNR